MQAAHPFQPKTILVPTDFSTSAGIAIKTAADLAKFAGAELYILNIIPMLPIVRGAESTFGFPTHEYLAQARAAANGKLEAIAAELNAQAVPCRVGIEIGNDVVGNIMMVADREHADLLVISTHGVSGWRPMIFGSIAEKVIKLADCPLMLLRSPKDLPQP